LIDASVRAVVLGFGIRSMADAMITGLRMSPGSMGFVKFPGFFKFMAFAGDSSESESHDEQGKAFHRGAS
jgi:hypothetical protein